MKQKQDRADPVTGDTLTLGEYISWMIQGVIRKWLFLGIITALTGTVWVIADPIWRHPLTDQWNLWASYLAIIIEGVTAMALINQTRRDAVVLREVRAIARATRAQDDELLKQTHLLVTLLMKHEESTTSLEAHHGQ